MSYFDYAIGIALDHEGRRFTDIDGDPGGATKFGITLRNAQEHNLDIDHDGDVDVDDIKNMSEADAREFFHTFWWLPVYDAIKDMMLATKVFDTAINVGQYKAHKWLQRAANSLLTTQLLDEDGVIGKKTITAVNSLEFPVLLDLYKQNQAGFYNAWCNAKPIREKFRKGLLARAAWPLN